MLLQGSEGRNPELSIVIKLHDFGLSHPSSLSSVRRWSPSKQADQLIFFNLLSSRLTFPRDSFSLVENQERERPSLPWPFRLCRRRPLEHKDGPMRPGQSRVLCDWPSIALLLVVDLERNWSFGILDDRDQFPPRPRTSKASSTPILRQSAKKPNASKKVLFPSHLTNHRGHGCEREGFAHSILYRG